MTWIHWRIKFKFKFQFKLKPWCLRILAWSIHSTVWPQYTNVTDKDRTDRQNRQWFDTVGQTVLQTVAQNTNKIKETFICLTTLFTSVTICKQSSEEYIISFDVKLSRQIMQGGPKKSHFGRQLTGYTEVGGNTNSLTSNVASMWRASLKRWIGDISACSCSAVTPVLFLIFIDDL